MSANYYKTLGISSNATLQEVKTAYRDKAKQLHPDVNKAPDAHEQFVELNEAYEYLEKKLTGKIPRTRRRTSSTHHRRKRQQNPEQEWYRYEREHARRRARYYANMKYRDFTSSDYYKSTGALNVFFDHVVIFVIILILLASPFIALAGFGWSGFGAMLLVILITLPGWLSLVKKRKLSLEYFRRSVSDLSKSWPFIFSLILIFNFLLMVFFILNTLIKGWIFLSIYIFSLLVGFTFYKLNRENNRAFKKKTLSIGMAFSAVNLFFLLNYVFSSAPTVEVYEFEPYHDGSRPTTLIELEGGVYSEYTGMRFFTDYSKLSRANHIKLEISEGLFGVRVLKDYEFFG